MQSLLKNNYFKSNFGLIICISLLIGFLYARAIHSITLLFVGLYWVAYYKDTLWLWKDKWFWSLLSIIFCVPVFDLINGSIIDNAFYIKMSLALYPLFFFAWNPNRTYIGYLHKSIFIILFILSVETFIRYIFNTEAINNDYKVAKVISIGHYSDHIRISAFIALSCILALYEILYNSNRRLYKVLLICYVVFQMIFLHFLTARTGLIVLYVSLFAFLLHLTFNKHLLVGILLMATTVSLPFISMKIFPSFYNRMGFVFWDRSYYERLEYREGSSDGLRYYSILSGIDIFKNHIIDGVGFHNLNDTSHQWLKSKFPAIKDSELIQPSSQLLIYAAGGGLVCLMILLIFIIYPLFHRKLLADEIFTSIYLGLTATFIFEILLENQFGTFVYGFCIFWVYYLTIKKFNDHIF